MAVASVAWNGTRIDASDATSSTTSIGGGAGAGSEPDIKYQGTEDTSRKVGTSAGGFWIDTTNTDITTATGTHQTLLLKVAIGNWSALETLATPGLQLRVGSSTAAYYSFNVAGSDNYPEKGGFFFSAIDPNIAGYRDGTNGSPNLATANEFAVVADLTSTSKSENVVMSAIDAGDGYTVTGGGGADPTASYADIADFNSTLANRHGFFFALEGQDGAYGQYGKVVWGSSATAVDYQDATSPTVFILDGLYAAGWAGIEDNVENASTVISPAGGTFISRGNTTTTDTRATYAVVGSAANGTRTSQTFRNFASFDAGSTFTYSGCVIQADTINQNGATFTGGAIRDGSTFVMDDYSTVSDVDFSDNTTAIDATAAIVADAVELDGITFSGNTTDVTVNSANDITIKNLNGSNATTATNTGAGSVSIETSVTIELTSLVAGSRVYIENTTDTAVLFNEVEATTTFTKTVNYVADKALLVRVRNASGATKYKAFETGGTLGSNGFSAQVNQILDE